MAFTMMIAHEMVAHAAAASTDPTMWYLTRTLAVAAYVAISLSVICGLLRTAARASGERLSWVFDELHQFLGLLGGIFIIGHLFTLLIDPFLPFTLLNILTIGNQTYRPLAGNLGVLAMYTIAGLLLTSWLRRFMPYGFWRGLHYASFAAYILVSAHGILAGSDNHEPWMLTVYIGFSLIIALLTVMRLLPSLRATPAVQRP